MTTRCHVIHDWRFPQRSDLINRRSRHSHGHRCVCLQVCVHSRACGNALLCCLVFFCAALSAIQRSPLPLHVNYSTQHKSNPPRKWKKNTRNNCIPETILMFSGTQALTLVPTHTHTRVCAHAHVRNIDILCVPFNLRCYFLPRNPLYNNGEWDMVHPWGFSWMSTSLKFGKKILFTFCDLTRLTPISTNGQQEKV